MDRVGYIENKEGQKLKIEFVLDKNNKIIPKGESDKENLINCWDIDDEILEAFVDFVNNEMKDDKEKIALLTNTQEYEFLEGEEIYNIAAFELGEEAAQEEIESLIDKIYDDAIFGYETLIFVNVSKTKTKKSNNA